MTIETDKVARINILLVDDQPARLLSYRTILEPLGENLVEASSGTQALARLMEDEYAVILLDVNMPGMDGFETAATIHEHPRFERTPIIFVTAVNVSDMDRLRGYTVGAVDYVTVPVIPEILRSKVMVLAELYRKRRELQQLNSALAAANEELRVEKAREVHKLNDILQRANVELEAANANLQSEVAERRRAEERLTDADRRKNEFLATLAHELRNPLAPVRSALNVHRLEPDPAMRAQLVGVVERQIQQLTRVVDDLLDIARITHGRLTLRKGEVELRGLVESAVETARPMVEVFAHRLEVDIRDGDLMLYVDGQRLSQVFSNLLNNACKYTPPGGTIHMRAGREGDELVVSVRDTGIGLGDDERERIFELFVQLNASLERPHGGLGVGLSLVRQLVEMHQGRVEVASGGHGLGSEFIVRVPLAKAPDAVAGAPEATTASARGLRVLIVDDNRDGADMLALTLGLLGHEVKTVYDPAQALAIAAAFLPDVAFLDIGMPGINGYDLAAQIRSEPWGGAPFLVALTGWGREEDRLRSARSGFDEHLVKPVELESIERICVTIMRGSPAIAASHR